MSIEELTTFLGWSSVINLIILTLSAIILILFKGKVAPLHAKMFSLKEENVLRAYFEYLGQYKILIIMFNITPYIALKVMY